MRNAHINMLLSAALLLDMEKGTAQLPDRNPKYPFTTLRAEPAPALAERSDAVTLWTENFENGLNGWIVETAYGPVDWELTNTGNSGGFTPGPLGGSSGYPGGHWIMADSDAGGTTGTAENTSITSPALLGFGSVHYMMLRFEQSFRQLNNDQTRVQVSGDGGADWTIYSVNGNVAGNQSTPNAPAAQVVTLNISSALANGSDDIRIRFEWISDEGYTYSWQVDEVSLLTLHTNDLTLVELDGQEHAAGSSHYGMPCTIYPVGETPLLNYKSVVANNGSAEQDNVHMIAEVSGPDGYSSTLNSPSLDMAPVAVDSLFLTGIELPDVVGDYSVIIHAVQDGTEDYPADNMMERHIRVDPEVYARDQGLLASARDNGGADYELGNRFWISGYQRVLQGVDVALGPGTEPGAQISAIVYDRWYDYVGSSDLHTVVEQDLNNYGGSTFINLPLPEHLELEGDQMYLVCVSVLADYGNVFTGISGTSEPQVSLIRPAGADTWYYTTSTPMVRMRLGSLVGFADAEVSPVGLQAFPSPFDGQATVVFTSKEGDTPRWELRDATGRLAMSGNMGRSAPGEHRILVDGEALGSGMYLMTVETGGVRSTVKLIHQAPQ